MRDTWSSNNHTQQHDLILTYSIYVPYTTYNLQVRTGSQNRWPLWTSNRTIGPVLPRARTLDRTTVRFCCVQVRTTVPNWTLPSLGLDNIRKCYASGKTDDTNIYFICLGKLINCTFTASPNSALLSTWSQRQGHICTEPMGFQLLQRQHEIPWERSELT